MVEVEGSVGAVGGKFFLFLCFEVLLEFWLFGFLGIVFFFVIMYWIVRVGLLLDIGDVDEDFVVRNGEGFLKARVVVLVYFKMYRFFY